MTYKKNWIFLKRGLITDPKHRRELGELIWLYLYILDRTDWDTGTVKEWRDAAEAEELNMPLSTLRDQRRKLETIGYITHVQGRRISSLVIHKWINPRRYDGVVQNVGDTEVSPLEFNGDTNGYTNGDTNGLPNPSLKNEPSLAHKSQVTKKKVGKAPDPLLSHPAVMAYREVLHLTPNEIQRKEIAERVGNNGRIESFKAHLKEWSMRGWSPKNITGILESFETGITSRSKPKGGGLTLLEAIQLDEQERAANGEQN